MANTDDDDDDEDEYLAGSSILTSSNCIAFPFQHRSIRAAIKSNQVRQFPQKRLSSVSSCTGINIKKNFIPSSPRNPNFRMISMKSIL